MTSTTLTEVEFREGLEGLTPLNILTLYRRAPLLRPVDDPELIWQMYENADLVLSAWINSRLVGIARVLSDWVLYSFLCDLAVEPDLQGRGIGRQLIHQVLERCKGTDLLLRDSDLSSAFYARLGFEKVENAWVWRGRK